MKTMLLTILACAMCAGCTTIKRESAQVDGSRSIYTVTSTMNRKAIEGLRFKDCGGCVELEMTKYTSDQDDGLKVIQAALEAYLATITKP